MKQVIIVTLFKPILWALDHLVLFVTNGCVKYLIYSSYRWAHRVLVAQSVKNLPAMQETLVQSLGQEDPLEKNWQPTPVFLPRVFYGQRSLAGYSPWGCKESDMTEQLTTCILKLIMYKHHLDKLLTANPSFII